MPRAIVIISLFSLLGQVIIYVSTPYIVKVYGAKVIGIFATFMAIVTIVKSLGSLG